MSGRSSFMSYGAQGLKGIYDKDDENNGVIMLMGTAR